MRPSLPPCNTRYILWLYMPCFTSLVRLTPAGVCALELKQAPVTNSSLSYTHLEGPPSYQITLSDDGARATKY